MNFGKPKSEASGIDITSLIDVVFILLIFFMVTTTFQREADLAVSLPQASQEPEVSKDMPLEIVINAHGQFYVGGQELVNNQIETLMRALQKVAVGQKDKPLVIRADARTPHQYVVTAMDAAAQLGLVRLSIATTQFQE
ncbi:MAG: biopolymer transporter ExbD [Gammaproteobacteria bacterium]|nr:biopolymer transporter ExbD [Gammaproteobacteria bacterium]